MDVAVTLAKDFVARTPPKRDSIGTQDRILAAAQAEFARRGYDGARVDAITDRGKVSKNLLYHHVSFTSSMLLERDLRASETLAHRKAHIVDMVLSYLTNGSPVGVIAPPDPPAPRTPWPTP